MANGSAGLSTVAAAVSVLDAFTDAHQRRGVTELAEELGMDKSRVHRLLAALVEGGLVTADPVTRQYSLGTHLITLGHRAARTSSLGAEAQPVLDRLARTTGETTVLCVPEALRYRTIAAADGPSQLRFASDLGGVYPGHLGATGHALFAFSPVPRIAGLLAETAGVHPAEIEDRHARTRDNGYSVSDGEFDSRVFAVAAPVHLGGNVIAALATIGPPQQMRGHLEEIIDAVRASVLDLESSITS